MVNDGWYMVNIWLIYGSYMFNDGWYVINVWLIMHGWYIVNYG